MKKADVEEYLSLHAQAALCDKRLKELREVLLPQLRDGAVSPKDLPFLLVLRKTSRTEKDYKAPLIARLVAEFGKIVAERRLAKIEAAFVKKDIEQLCVEQNKEYAAQLAA